MEKEKKNNESKSDRNKINMVKINQMSKKVHYTKSKRFTKRETILLKFLMIIL